MNTLALLITKAQRKHGLDIKPASNLPWEKCLTIIGGSACLWYNTPDDSTHIVRDNDWDLHFLSSQFDMLNAAVILGYMSKKTVLDLKNKISHLWEMDK